MLLTHFLRLFMKIFCREVRSGVERRGMPSDCKVVAFPAMQSVQVAEDSGQVLLEEEATAAAVLGQALVEVVLVVEVPAQLVVPAAQTMQQISEPRPLRSRMYVCCSPCQ